MTGFTDFLDRNLERRRNDGGNIPLPGRRRLVGDLTPGRIYDNVRDFCGATAYVAVFHNVEAGERRWRMATRRLTLGVAGVAAL